MSFFVCLFYLHTLSLRHDQHLIPVSYSLSWKWMCHLFPWEGTSCFLQDSPPHPNLASSTIGHATEKSWQITTLNSRSWKPKCKAEQSPLVQADHIISCLHMIWAFRIAEDEPLTCHLDLDLWGIVLPPWDSCQFKLKRLVMTKT